MGKLMGLSGEYVSQSYQNIIKGKKNVSTRAVRTLLENHPDLNLNWLYKGEGEIFSEKNENILHEPELKYRTKQSLYDFRALVEEVEALRVEVERLKRLMRGEEEE